MACSVSNRCSRLILVLRDKMSHRRAGQIGEEMVRLSTTYAALMSVLLLTGCSFQSTLDKMVSRERQAEIVSLGERFCVDSVSLSKADVLHPEVVASVRDAAELLPGECPADKASWQLASYQWTTNITDGTKQRQEEAVVVGEGRDKWTTISLRFYAEGDAPMQIVTWNVLGSREKPAALLFVEQYDTTANALRYALPITFALIVALIFWMVRRHRAKQAAD